jgi:DivIVA domain-containing protein
VSTADIEVLGPPQADDLYNPEFAVVLRGYDPEEVRAYVQNVATHIEALQRQLTDARDQIEAGRRQYMAAKEAAYKQLATQMAELLHMADNEAERLKREGAEEAGRKTAEAERISFQLRREAEDHAETMRREGEESLWRARAEAERVLGGLAIKRDELLKELEATRGRLRGVMGSLESTIMTTREDAKRGSDASAEIAELAHTEVAAMDQPQPPVAERGAPAMAPEGSADLPADVAATDAPVVSDEQAEHVEQGEQGEQPQRSTAANIWNEKAEPRQGPPRQDELLQSVEGFDLVLPDIRIDEEGDIR